MILSHLKIFIFLCLLSQEVLAATKPVTRRSSQLKTPQTTSDSYQFRIWLEPAFGYDFGSYEAQSTYQGVQTLKKTSANGLGLGLKLGASIWGYFFGGLDFHYASLGYNKEFRSENTISGARFNHAGLFVGVRAPSIPIRFWLGYGFSSRYSIIYDGSDDVRFTGTSWKMGGAFEWRLADFFAPISFNIEYWNLWIHSAYGLEGRRSEVSLPGEVGAPPTRYEIPSVQAFIFSISLPMQFGF